MTPFCAHHSEPVELEDGYPVLPCKLHYKVCPFKIKGAAEFCPDVKLDYYKFDFPKDCEGGQCKL